MLGLCLKRPLARWLSLVLVAAALSAATAGHAQTSSADPSNSATVSPTPPADATVTRDSSPPESVEKGKEWLAKFLAGSQRAAEVTVSVVRKWIDKIPGKDSGANTGSGSGEAAPMGRDSGPDKP